MNKYIIDNYEKWLNAYSDDTFSSLYEYKLIFYNKEHFERYWPKSLYGTINMELGKIKTYTDAILYKNSSVPKIRTLCKFILKGDIEIYD